MYHKRVREKPGWFGGWKLLGLAIIFGTGAAAIPGMMFLLTWPIPEFRWPMGGLTVGTLILMPVYLMLTSFRPWR